MGKWLWRLGEKENSVWRQIIVAKYSVKGNSWTDGAPHGSLGIWKGIVSIKDAFTVGVRYGVDLGDKILFWHDIWVGARPLASQFQTCIHVPEIVWQSLVITWG